MVTKATLEELKKQIADDEGEMLIARRTCPGEKSVGKSDKKSGKKSDKMAFPVSSFGVVESRGFW